jgi:hypothetical protein
MILIGHPLVQSEKLYAVSSVEEIKKTPSNATLYVHFQQRYITLIKHCQDHGVSIAIRVKSLMDAILSNAFKARFIICEKSLAPKIQRIAENYLFDSKILCIVSTESDIEWCAHHEIDGIIFEEVLN